jgi:para-nitrobenzyl esterase
MRARPAAEIVTAINGLLLAGKYSPGPTVDGWVLPDATGRIFARGKQLRVPLMIGSNAREMTTLRVYLPRVDKTPEAYRAWLTTTVGPAAPQVEALYPAKAAADVEGAVIDFSTDLFFTCPARFAARSTAKAGAPVYLYWFTRVRPGGQSLGAYHAGEINYVFGTQEAWLPREAVDDSLADAMQRYWVAFATTGRPAAKGLPEWPRYTEAGDQHLELGPTIGPKPGLRREACDIVEPGIKLQWGPEP